MGRSKLRLLSVSNCPLVESQGSGYVTVNFARQWRDRGHTVDEFGPDDYELCQWWRGRANHYRIALGMVGLVWSQLRRQHYDVLEFYGAEAWLIILLLRWCDGAARWLARLRLRPQRGQRYLVVSHSNGIEPHVSQALAQYRDLWPTTRRWYQWDQRGLFQWAFRAVDGVITQSHFDRDFALVQGYQPPHQVVTIPSGLPEVYRDRAVNFERDRVLGYCGSWLSRKGIAVLVADVSAILREWPAVRFKLIGVGDRFQPETIFPADVLHQIEVIPFVAEKSVLAEIYESLAILLMPSWYESFGLVAAEAMACGCAVIATNVGIITHLHDGEAVLKLPTARSPYLYQAIQYLCQHEPCRRQLAQAGYHAAQQWHWADAIAQIESTYLRWLKAIRQDGAS